MNTPITDRATLSKWQDSCPLQVVPKSLAVALELDRAALIDCLAHLECKDWFKDEQDPGYHEREVICGLDPRKVRAALAAARANFPKP
jgi:hypothetical protein